MSIILQGSTSGSVTLQEPAVAGSTVLDLPATSGTVALTSQISTPKVINVQRLENSTRASLSSGTIGSPATLVTFTYNKQSASTSLLFIVMIPLWSNNAGSLACDLTYGSSSAFGSLSYTYTAQTYVFSMIGQATLTGYTTTGSQTLTVRHYAVSGSGAPSSLVNPNATDDSRNIQQVSTVTVIEYV
jgi:hypothetical protein